MKMVPLGDLMPTRTQSLNPAKHAEEEFELHSIPAFDRGRPDISLGRDIGSSKQVVQPGDVLISKIVPHIRRSAVIPKLAGRRQLASSEWIVFRNQSFDPKYLVHFLMSDVFHHQFLNTVAGVGGSLLRARPQYVRSIMAPLPPLDEQRRIAAILDKADAIRQKRRQATTHLETLAQSIFQTMFGSRLAESSSTTIGDVAQLQGGKSLSSIDDSAATKNRVLKISSVTSGTFKPWESKPVPDDYSPPLSHFSHKGDLLISRANTSELVGASALVHVEPQGLLLPDKIWRFDWLIETQPEYFFHLLRTKAIRGRISNMATGSGGSMKNISKPKLLSVQIPRIESNEQREFVKQVRKVDVLRAKFDESNADQLFASLQSRAFRGEL
ncbi:restriction endonuclease subunit S [Brevibacterium aurantiacum]|uniref:restriction endonuclease subunit S n=1 Tax=Brevibacterium aurantiacum TaxID=273384 RepID=UPI0001BC2C80|nr:restriction endonuclease subunit S [Brevibacterium aurantiacum]